MKNGKVGLALFAIIATLTLAGCGTGAGLKADGKLIYDTGKGILTATFTPPAPEPVAEPEAPAIPAKVYSPVPTLEK